MKESFYPSPLVFALIVLLAGSLSPSNGLDDGMHKTPLELLAVAFAIIAAGLAGYLLIHTIGTGAGFKPGGKQNDLNF